jgi:hypothetical protein
MAIASDGVVAFAAGVLDEHPLALTKERLVTTMTAAAALRTRSTFPYTLLPSRRFQVCG